MAEAAEGLLYEFAAEDDKAAASWGALRSCALRAWRALDVMGRVLVLAALFSSAVQGGAAAALVTESARACSYYPSWATKLAGIQKHVSFLCSH